MTHQFSVVMPVYWKVDPSHLHRSLQSVLEQSRPPDEVLIVKDGPLGPALEAVIEGLLSAVGDRIRTVALPNNRGTGLAFDRGLREARYAIVARMDADDIALPHRFERQLAVLDQGYDVVGSSMLEFENDESNILGIRKLPSDEHAIQRYARFNNPINTPTSMMRRDQVLAAGGSRHLPYLEDYDMFARMLSMNMRMINLDEPLLLFRSDPGVYRRRAGWGLLASEWQMQNNLRAYGLIGPVLMARNMVTRSLFRLLPGRLLRKVHVALFREAY